MVLRSVLLALFMLASAPASAQRPLPRDVGITVGILPPGKNNAITDVQGVRVGHTTVQRGKSVNTGVTAILPPGDNVFQRKVPAAIVVGNGFGKLVGVTQVRELGELESPIVLTCTLCVPRAADAVLTYLLGLPGNEEVRSANAVVGETNDGFLNDIRARPISESDVLNAITTAATGPVTQGNVGAGTGTTCFGWKGGIGTSSRLLPASLGGWTLGVLVQTNFGGVLTIAGAPVGQELGQYYLKNELAELQRDQRQNPDGSIMMVVATDAPLDAHALERLATRALAGMARTGSSMSGFSGDYVIAFSTLSVAELDQTPKVGNAAMSPLFQAVIEATEEAIYNSMFAATTLEGDRGVIEALPLQPTLEILRRHGVIKPQ